MNPGIAKAKLEKWLSNEEYWGRRPSKEEIEKRRKEFEAGAYYNLDTGS